MALSPQARSEAVSLMSSESNFERSGISGQRASKSSLPPRQGELPEDVYRDLVETISRDDVSYVIFSYQTPIAWVHRNGAVTMPEIGYSATTSQHRKMVREAFPDLVNVRDMLAESRAAASVTAPSASQYAELGEDDLIELASGLGSRLSEIRSEMIRQDTTLELVAVVEALKARRDATAKARHRIGEYLRHQGLLEAKYQAAQASTSDHAKRTDKQPDEVVSEVRADEYTVAAKLLLSDLNRVVGLTVRDSKAEFYAEQEARLAHYLEHQGTKLPEKQRVLLACIAKGHITAYSTEGYRQAYDTKCDTCQRPDGRTVGALERKGFLGSRRGLGWNSGSTLCLKKPS
jgi:hypothetical protein